MDTIEGKVKRTTEPTLQQLLDMAANLQFHFNKPASVDVKAWHYGDGVNEPNKAHYSVYVAEIGYFDYDSWEACQNKYFQMMDWAEPSEEAEDEQHN